jgi:hypothetical protein
LDSPKKTVSQIAKETGCSYDEVYQVACHYPSLLFDEHQERLIHLALYFTSKTNELTLESKINKIA